MGSSRKAMNARAGSRIRVALIDNALTPYRVHLHRRLAREAPELEIWTLLTHEQSNSPWQLQAPEEIRPVPFGAGESSLSSDRIGRQGVEWLKGGRVVCWLRENEIQAVVLGGYNDAGRLRVLAACKRDHRPCFVFGDSNIRGDQPAGWRGALKRGLLPMLLRQCSGVLCCGSCGEAYFERYGVERSAMFRYPYEPNYESVQSVGGAEADSARERFQLRGDRSYLLYAGRLVREKRVDLLLGAFTQLSAERPDWDLVVAGDGALREGLQKGLPHSSRGRVHWTGFIAEERELHRLFAVCRALVLPSDYEPWGVVVTEAAARMPVVASDRVGAAADLIEDGVNGKIFEAGDEAGLLNCLREVTRDGVCDRMTELAPRRFAEWRKRSDPLEGLRAALRSVGLVP